MSAEPPYPLEQDHLPRENDIVRPSRRHGSPLEPKEKHTDTEQRRNQTRIGKPTSRRGTGAAEAQQLPSEASSHSEETPPIRKATTSPERKKGRGTRKRKAAQSSDEESSFLVEMETVSPVEATDDARATERDPEQGESMPRGKGGFYLRGLAAMLSVLTAYWLNFGLVLVPFPILLYFANWHRGALFIITLLSLFPVNTFIKTSQLGFVHYCAPWLGYTLSLLLRNLMPVLIGVFAVRSGLVRLVQGLIMGSLLHRLLLLLGLCTVVNARSKTSRIDERNTRMASSILYLAIIILILPSLFQLSSPDSGIGGILKISRWCAMLLLLLLGSLLYYSLRFEPKFWELSLPPFCSPVGPIAASITAVLGGFVAGVMAWLFIHSAVWVNGNWGLGYTFIAGILLPLALNAADSIDYIKMTFVGNARTVFSDAIRGGVEMCMFVAPLLVLGGWIVDKPIGLHFFGLVAVSGIFAIINLTIMLSSLKSNWFQGVAMIVTFLLFVVCWFLQSE